MVNVDGDSVTVRRDGPVTIVTICRPEVRNAVDRPTAAALCTAFEAFDADDTAAVAALHRWVARGQQPRRAASREERG